MREFLLRTVGHPAGFLGLTAMIFAVGWFSERVSFDRRAVLAESEIISVGPARGKNATGVFIQYVYQDAGGRKWQGAANYSPIKVGERIGVLYDPLNPRASEIEGGFPRWTGSVPLFIFGAVLVIVGWNIAGRKKPAPPPPPP